MPPVKSIKLSIICGAVLGTSIVCSTAFAQSLNPGPTPPPTPGPHPGSKVIPHPHSEPESLCFAAAVAAARCPEGGCSNTSPGT
jgi:hypothetical protein